MNENAAVTAAHRHNSTRERYFFLATKTRAPREVGDRPHIREAGRAGEFRRFVQMPFMQLEGDGAAVFNARKHHGRRRRTTSSPSSPPSSASSGFVGAHLARDVGQNRRGHIRRVRHHHVELSHETIGDRRA